MKIITLSLISVSLLISGNPIHDLMDNRIKGQSYSGTLDDNVAAEDGLGVLPLQHHTGTTEINNELLVQKVFKRIVQTETDKTKTVNIRTSLTLGTVGDSVDQSLLSNAGFKTSYIAGSLSSCKSIKSSYPTSENGIYVIRPISTPISVYCDMTTDGGGWTLVWSNLLNKSGTKTGGLTWVNAVGNEVFFNGTINSNKETFEVYTGLALWNDILGASSGQLRYEWRYNYGATISQDVKFNLTAPVSTDNFTLKLSNPVQLTGSQLPGMYSYHNNRQFTAYDADHDAYGSNCAANYNNSPWWYGACWDGSINGYNDTNGANWYSSNGSAASSPTSTGGGNGWIWLR